MSNDSMQFYTKLKDCSENKDSLLKMAAEAIAFSHDKRTLAQRRSQDLQFNPTSINLASTIGTIRAFHKQNLSTNDKLCMIINKYIGLAIKDNPKLNKPKALEDFDCEFAKRYPNMHGAAFKYQHREKPHDSSAILSA